MVRKTWRWSKWKIGKMNQGIVILSRDHLQNGNAASSLQLFPCAETGKRSCIIVLPGGSYRYLADHEGTPVAERFAQMGFHSAVCRYRTLPNHYPAPLEDVSAAIEYIRNHAEELNIKPDKIALLGFSAGGHLAAMASQLLPISKRPDAVILCYPVLSPEAHIESYRNLLGTDNEADCREYQRFSWSKQVDSTTRPAFIWHCEDDEVDVRSAMDYAKALKTHHIKVELHVFTAGSHGLGLGRSDSFPEVRVWPELAAAFLHRYGW